MNLPVNLNDKNTISYTFIFSLSGIPQLRQAIVDFHKHHDDVDLNSSDVIVGPGSKELIFLLMNIFKGGILRKDGQ